MLLLIETKCPCLFDHMHPLRFSCFGDCVALKKDNIASETKMETSQLRIPRAVDNHKAIAAIQGVSYSLSPYAAFSRGSLHSWIFAGLSTGAASNACLFLKIWIKCI